MISLSVTSKSTTPSSVALSPSSVSIPLALLVLLLLVAVVLFLSRSLGPLLGLDLLLHFLLDVIEKLIFFLLQLLLSFVLVLLLLLAKLLDLLVQIIRLDGWGYTDETKLVDDNEIDVQSFWPIALLLILWLLPLLFAATTDNSHLVIFLAVSSHNLTVLHFLIKVLSVVLGNEIRLSFLCNFLRCWLKEPMLPLQLVAILNQLIASLNLFQKWVLPIFQLNFFLLNFHFSLLLIGTQTFLLINHTFNPSNSFVLQLEFVKGLPVLVSQFVFRLVGLAEDFVMLVDNF